MVKKDEVPTKLIRRQSSHSVNADADRDNYYNSSRTGAEADTQALFTHKGQSSLRMSATASISSIHASGVIGTANAASSKRESPSP